MDYETETSKLNQGSNTWKPSIGSHTVVILEEPEKTEYKDKLTDAVTPQIKMQIRVKDEELTWFVSEGKTTQSVYGQLMWLGKAKGKLKGETITLLVNSVKAEDGGTRNNYIVVEAMDAIKEAEVPQEKVA